MTTPFVIWVKNEGLTASYILFTNSFGSEEQPSALNSALSKSFCPGVVNNKGFGSKVVFWSGLFYLSYSSSQMPNPLFYLFYETVYLV